MKKWQKKILAGLKNGLAYQTTMVADERVFTAIGSFAKSTPSDVWYDIQFEDAQDALEFILSYYVFSKNQIAVVDGREEVNEASSHPLEFLLVCPKLNPGFVPMDIELVAHVDNLLDVKR